MALQWLQVCECSFKFSCICHAETRLSHASLDTWDSILISLCLILHQPFGVRLHDWVDRVCPDVLSQHHWVFKTRKMRLL